MAVLARAVPIAFVALLGGLPTGSAQEVSRADVEGRLISELVGLVGKEEPGEHEAALQPIYGALPKDSQGTVEPQAARDALRRLFLEQRGWSVQGWVPSHLMDLLEQRLGGRGIELRELAAVARAFESLVRQEAESRVEKAYRAQQLPTAGQLGSGEAAAVVRAYLADYTGTNSSDEVPEHAQELLRRVDKSLYELSAKEGLGLPAMKRVAVAMGEQYGHFHRRQCAAGAGPRCLEASSLYAVCCPEEAEVEDPIFLPAMALSALALLAAAVRRLCVRFSSSGTGEVEPATTAEAEAEAEDEDDLKKPQPAAPRRSTAWAGSALLVAVLAGFATGVLDATALAGALFGGLILLSGARMAPKQGGGAKAKES